MLVFNVTSFYRGKQLENCVFAPGTGQTSESRAWGLTAALKRGRTIIQKYFKEGNRLLVICLSVIGQRAQQITNRRPHRPQTHYQAILPNIGNIIYFFRFLYH